MPSLHAGHFSAPLIGVDDVIRKIDGRPVVMGNVPAAGDALGRSLSSTNFHSLAPKPAPAQPAATAPAPASPSPATTGTPAKS